MGEGRINNLHPREKGLDHFFVHMKKEVFKIQGMHCASCAMTIQRAVADLVGIKSAQVNFGAETLLVEYNES